MLMSLIAALRRALRHGATHVLLITGSATTLAQTPPSPAASAPIADHVKRAAERPFYWIKLNAQTSEAPAPRPKSAAKPVSKTPPTADGAAPAGPLPARVSGITERVTPLIENPTLATSDPEPSNTAQSLIATLESAPPAAGQTLPPPAPASADAGPLGADAPAAPAVAPAAARSRVEASASAATASTNLRLLRQIEPDFPSSLQRRLRQGSVEVSFTVLPDGSVSAPNVLRSSHPRLDAPALEAVAQWRFAPIDAAKPGVVVLGFDLD